MSILYSIIKVQTIRYFIERLRYEVCLFAWQTDDWSSLRKNKFHPSIIRNEVGFCDLWSLGGYLSASFMIIPAGKGQSSGETIIDLLAGIFIKLILRML